MKVLTGDQQRILELFLNNYDTNSDALKTMMTQVYKTFVNEVGLKASYSQEEVDEWINNHEKKNQRPNNNCRLFLQKFMSFIGQDGLQLRKVKKYKGTPKPIPKHSQLVKILQKALELYGIEFTLYLKIIDIGALRKMEALSIRPIDIEYDIDSPPPKVKVHGKGNRDRFVVLPYDFYKKMIEFILKNGIEDSEPIFKIGYRQAQKQFEMSCIKAGFYNFRSFTTQRVDSSGVSHEKTYRQKVSMFSLHRLRHRRATVWNDRKIPLANISKMLGHSDVSTTQIYIDTNSEKIFNEWAMIEYEDLKERIMIKYDLNSEEADLYIDKYKETLPQRRKNEGDDNAI